MKILTHFWFWSQLFTLSEKGGVYLNLKMWKYGLISGFGLSCSPHLKGGISECKYLYIYRSAKFGVAVFKASMLDWLGVHLPEVYVHCSAITCDKFGVVVLKASMLKWLGGQSAMGIYALLYIYRSAKFGVVVFKASMLNCNYKHWYNKREVDVAINFTRP